VSASYPGSPYQGLKPFDESAASFFFGRDADRSIICSNFMASRLTLLFGVSGVGKTSLLHAGVATEIGGLTERNRAEFGTAEFAIVIFSDWGVPDPALRLLSELHNAVMSASGQTPEPLAPGVSLTESLRGLASRLDGTLLVALDQFEQYFVYHERDAAGLSFASFFLEAADARLPVNFLISIREDALAKLDRFAGRLPGLFDNRIRLEHLDHDAAREAIERPIQVFNDRDGLGEPPYRIESELVDSVLDQVRLGQVNADARSIREEDLAPKGAPQDIEPFRVEASYLQLVMSRLWEEERSLGSRTLRLQTLDELGGARVIVRRHFKEVIGRLSRHEQSIAADVLRYLVSPSGSRIAQELSSLAKWTEHSADEVQSILQKLASTEGRILRRPQGTRQEETYEIYHDIIAGDVAKYVEDERKRKEDRRRRAITLGLTSTLAAVVLLLGLALWQWIIAARERTIAKAQTEIAEKQRRSAESRRLVAVADTQLDGQPDLALLLAVEARRFDDTAEARSVLFGGLRRAQHLRMMLHTPRSQPHLLAFSPDGTKLAVAGRGEDSDAVTLWDIAASTRLHEPLDMRQASVKALRFTRDGTKLVMASGTRGDRVAIATITNWDIASGKRTEDDVGLGPGDLTNLALGPDGKMLAAVKRIELEAAPTSTLRIWEGATDQFVEAPPEKSGDVLFCSGFSPDGQRLAVGRKRGDRCEITVWSLSGPHRESVLKMEHSDHLHVVEFSPDGKSIAVGGRRKSRGFVDVWDSDSAATPLAVLVQLDDVFDLDISPDGKTLAAAGYVRDHGAVALSHLDRIVLESPDLHGGQGDIVSVAFSPNGKSIAGGGTLDPSDERGAVFLWDLQPQKPLARSNSLGGYEVDALAASPDGRSLAVGVSNADLEKGVVRSEVVLLDPELGSERRPFELQSEALIGSLVFTPDGKVLAAALKSTSKEKRNGILLWNVASGQRQGFLEMGSDFPFLAASPSGTILAASGATGHVRLWNVPTQLVGTLDIPIEGQVSAVGLSPDGQVLAISGGREDRGRIFLLERSSWRLLDQPIAINGGIAGSLAFLGSGETLAGGVTTGRKFLNPNAPEQPRERPNESAKGRYFGWAALWDVATRKPKESPLSLGTAYVMGIASAPGGKILAVAASAGGFGSKGGVFLWDIESGYPLSSPLLEGGENIHRVAFSPDGRVLYAGGGKDDRAIVTSWDIDPISWVGRAGRIANRNLSRSEWNHYIGRDVPYSPTFPDLPSGLDAAEPGASNH
jgi:WD40 repeat protein